MTARINTITGTPIRSRDMALLAPVISNADRMTAGEFTARNGQLWTRLNGMTR
jgi:hypothetical protein